MIRLLALLWLFGQVFEGVTLEGVQTAAVATGDCATTTCLAVMDFEGSACADGDAGGEGLRTCTIENTANADCDSENDACPLEQDLSGMTDGTTEAFVVDSLSALSGTEIVTLDFIWRMDVAGTPSLNVIAGMISTTTNYDCRMRHDNATTVAALSNNGSPETVTVAEDTTYWVRLNLNIDLDDCRLLIWSDSWGGTLIAGGDVTSNGTSGTDSIVGYRFESPVSTSVYLWDDVGYCQDDLTTGSVHCSD